MIMETIKQINQNEFTTYPAHRVCAIVDTDMDARSAMDELLRSGIKEDQIDIFYGSEGIEVLDAEGEHHGLEAKIAKKIRGYGDVENEALRIYETAMGDGGYVFEVLAETDEEKESIHRILALNNAHQINYFGTWHIEAMTEA